MSHYNPLTAWRVSRFVFVVLLLMLACSRAAHADTWTSGQMVTYTQFDWSDPLLTADFLRAYPSGSLVLGDTTNYVMVFTSAANLIGYMPASGVPESLDQNYVNPTSTGAGLFGGDVLGLQLNVDFSADGYLTGSLGVPFGDLILENFNGLPALDGETVQELLDLANMELGGSTSGYPPAALDELIQDLNAAFDGGAPSQFAQDYLVAPGGTSGAGGGTTVPEPSSALLLGVGLLGLGAVQYKRRASVSSIAA